MRKLLLILVLSALCLLAVPAAAQDATAEPTADDVTSVEVTAPADATAEPTAEAPAEPTAEAPAEDGEAAPIGLSTLILLIGLGAVAVVGLAVVARDNFKERDGNA